MRRPTGRTPDFNRFEQALKSREPGPVPFGDLFADREMIGSFLDQRVGIIGG